MKTKVLLHIGGATGSNSVPAARILHLDGGSPTEFITKPLMRQEFGTHTTALGLIVDNVGYVIDNGTGVGQVAEFMTVKGIKEVYVLQTHFHEDHVCGLPQNSLLFQRDVVRAIYAPRLGTKIMSDVMDERFNPANWPVSPKLFKINHMFVSFTPGDSIQVPGKPDVKTMLLNHAGGSVGYRIQTPAGTVVIATDNELDENIRDKAAEFFSAAMIVYVDVQYRDAEYRGEQTIGPGHTKVARKGWGHSTPSMLRETLVKCAAAPRNVLVGHHDPKRPDSDLGAFESEMRKELVGLEATSVSFARECQTITVGNGTS